MMYTIASTRVYTLVYAMACTRGKRCTSRARLAAQATLLKKQKPCERVGVRVGVRGRVRVRVRVGVRVRARARVRVEVRVDDYD